MRYRRILSKLKELNGTLKKPARQISRLEIKLQESQNNLFTNHTILCPELQPFPFAPKIRSESVSGSSGSIKYFNIKILTKGIKNGCNEVATELHVVQFWSEILLVISD